MPMSPEQFKTEVTRIARQWSELADHDARPTTQADNAAVQKWAAAVIESWLDKTFIWSTGSGEELDLWAKRYADAFASLPKAAQEALSPPSAATDYAAKESTPAAAYWFVAGAAAFGGIAWVVKKVLR